MKKFVMTAVVALVALGTVNAADAFVYGGGLIKVGSRGTQVMDLQKCLADMGVNSHSNIDGIFGSKTKAAVMAFQAQNNVAVDGIIGPVTGPLYTAACADVEAGEEEEEESNEETEFESSNGEEADVTIEDVKSEDDLNNNEEEQHAFTFEVEADEDGGAAQIERVDLEFTITQVGSGEDDVYDIIEKVTIEVDGDEVAAQSSDDDDDWRGDNDNVLRISGLDTVVESDESVDFDVLLDIADLDEDDDLSGSNGIEIELTSVEIRYTDEAGITDTVDTNEKADVEIEALDAIEFDVDESNDNPDQDETVSLDEDVDGVVAFVNDVTVDEQDGTLEKVTVAFEFDATAGNVDIDDLVSDITIEFDGDDIEADDIDAVDAGSCSAGGHATQSACEGASETWTASVTGFTAEFDMDDMEIEVDDEFEVTVSLDLEELEDGSTFIGRSFEAKTITFEGEDQDDDNFSVVEDVDNAVELSLSAGALKLEDSSVDGYNEVGSDDDAAKAVFEVEVKADGDEDIRIIDFMFSYNDGAETVTVGASNPAYTVTVKDGDDDAVALDAGTTTLTTEYEINDGSSETFEITVFLDNAGSTAGAGEFNLELESISWEEDTLGNDFASGTTLGTLEVSLEADEIDLVA